MGDVTVHTSGPMFDGRARAAVSDGLDAAREAVAEDAANTVRAATIVFRRPTGFYVSRITTSNRADSTLVHDQGVIYGPWLEGVSRRNRTSRFKGYSIWRRTFQVVQGRAPTVARRAFEPFIRRMQ